jgi:hypothetical protein
MPPRTIDNLGMEVSTRYAEDQKILDPTIIKEAKGITIQTGIEVTIPFFPSEMEALLHFAPLQASWAFFIAPEFYFEQRKRLFTFQSIPSLGSEDKKESQIQKILTKIQLLEEKRKNQDRGEQDPKKRREQELAFQEEEREKKILTTLLQTIAQIDKLIIDINSRRSQYQKG